jgi:uncharacterized protein (TIGR03086 family)
MEPREFFDNVLDAATQCIKGVQTDQLGNETPCTDWDLRQLLNHMVYELAWLPDMLAGKTVAEVGDKYEGDLLGNDVPAAWDKAVANARTAVEQADLEAIVHLSYGEKPAGDYVVEVASDLLIHTWDAGQSMHCSERFADKLAQAAYDYLEPRIEDWRKAGVIGPAVTIPDDAPLLHRLLALAGRHPTK